MKILEQSFLVVGAGKSGIAAITLLKEKHCKARLYDGKEDLDIAQLRTEHPILQDIEIICGDMPTAWMEEADIMVLSPGVPTDLPFVEHMRKLGKRIWGEIELAYTFGKGEVIAITGTNGKTTTTTLVSEIMKAHYAHTDVVGNIGIPYTTVVANQEEDTVTTAEISSFQLETIEEFHPKVSAILNITPDHLNRHHTMENYVKAKEDICMNQTKDDVCVLNYDNEYTHAFMSKCPARVIAFSSKEEISDGYYYKDGVIYGYGKAIMKETDMNLVGLCNIENVMAALAIAEAMDVPLETTLSVIRTFKAVEHRIEFVATKRGVDYYNDSKGTNPDAAIQGIRAMTKPTILIGGGYDKGSEYDEWIENFDGKVKLFVLLGQTRDK
ncbi:MAG: UDP-N-acetylmuramoyl-L-alanine--D-glutamate ligase, partial [Lachnospiraceae bacterium]|nr:UDP-N-acetylmuramoyl-L-alanine--D-glutamate ligase [Lachnospiraceae bacterium]